MTKTKPTHTLYDSLLDIGYFILPRVPDATSPNYGPVAKTVKVQGPGIGGPAEIGPRLAAAAPDLLAALKLAAHALKDYDEPAILSEAEAAIARATDQQED